MGNVFKSPLLPLGGAVLANQFSWPLVRWGLLVYGLHSLWKWWAALVLTINGANFKEAQTPLSRKQRQMPPRLNRPRISVPMSPLKSNGGQATHPSTPKSESAAPPKEALDFSAGPMGMTEWAPFSGSLPYGGSFAATVETPYWLSCDGSVFDIRNIRYNKTREKIPSERAIYDCVGMDMVRDKRKIEGFIDRLPGGLTNLPESPVNCPAWDAAWGVPRVLVVNCQLPLKAGSIMGGRHPEDDGGLSVLTYFVLSREACETLAQGIVTPALRLWKRFVEEGVSTKEGNPLKVVGRVENLEKYEVPESFHRFNNKPVLLTKSSRTYLSRLPEVMEVDYDVRTWVYPARTTLCNYHHRAREAEIAIGYLVEGKTDDELPEQILGSFKLVNMDIMAARWVSVM